MWQRRPQRLSLRARLLWTFLLPLAVVLVLVGVVSTAALRHELIGQVDDQLSAAVARGASPTGGYAQVPPATPPLSAQSRDGDDGPGGPDFLHKRGQSAGTLGALVPQGGAVRAIVLTEGGHDEYLSSEQNHVLATVPVDGGPRTVDLGSSLGQYRVLATTAPDGDVMIAAVP